MAPVATATSPADLQKKPLKAGERVIVTTDIRGAAEGTPGRVKMAVGLTWPRYWVEFKGGRWIGSVSQTHLVRERDWDEYRQLREEERLRPKVVDVAAPESAGEGDAAPATGAASRVPAHLLERSRKARERLAGAG